MLAARWRRLHVHDLLITADQESDDQEDRAQEKADESANFTHLLPLSA
jgi:hypothetical protein